MFIVFQGLNHKIVKQWLATKSKIVFVLPSNCLLLLFTVTWNFSLTWTWSKSIKIKELITWETCQVTLIYISGYKNPYYIKQLQSLQTLFKALKPNPQKIFRHSLCMIKIYNISIREFSFFELNKFLRFYMYSQILNILGSISLLYTIIVPMKLLLF